MMESKNSIGSFGYFTAMVATNVGISLFAYPSQLAVLVNTDGWIVTFFAGAIMILLFYAIYVIEKNHNYQRFYDILKSDLGKYAAPVIGLLFILYNIIFISICLRRFSEVTRMYLLNKTPTEFIIMTMILVALYIVRCSAVDIVKFNVISTSIMTVVVLILIALTSRNADFTNIFPIMNGNGSGYLRAVSTAMLSFGGINIAYLLIPYIKNKKKSLKVGVQSIIFTTILYAIVCVMTLADFGVNQLKELIWPAISSIKLIQIPGGFIERWDGLVMAMWIAFYYTTFINLFYFSCDVIKDIFNLEDVKISSYVLIPFIYVLALFNQNVNKIYDFDLRVMPFFYTFSLVITPLIILIVDFIRKRGALIK